MSSLTIQPKAKLQMAAADDWWRENRPAAQMLFVDEVAGAVSQLKLFPELSPLVPHPRRNNVRRRALLRTGYAVYYTYEPVSDHVDVLAVWSSHRGGLPF